MKRRAVLQTSAVAGLSLSVPGIVGTVRGQATIEPLGRLPITGAAEAVVGDDGETAYVAATTGFATVDVSDPAEPALLAVDRDIQLEGETMTEILDISVDGDLLVVAGPANQRRSVAGFRCYDVSDPENPEPVGEHRTGYHVHNCYLEGELLFIVVNTRETNRLAIFDVGGDEITQVGYWSLLEHEPGWRDIYWLARYSHDVYVQNGIAYLPCWNAGTYLLDISDPTEPAYISHVQDTTLEAERAIDDWREAVYGLPGNDHYAAVDDTGDLLAVGREAWATGGAEPDRPGGIDLYDVSDSAAPVHRGSIDAPRADDESKPGGMWTTSHNFELRDGRLYSSWYRAGVKIHDVSDPAAPELLAEWRNTGETGFWTARVLEPGETFIASSTEGIPNTSLEGALYTFQTEPADRGGADGNDPIPVFTGVVGLAGGAVALEWLRRRGNVQD